MSDGKAMLAKATERPFSSGSEFSDWTERNCDRCERQRACDLKTWLVRAYMTDGLVPRDVAERLGRLDDYDASREPTHCTARVLTPAEQAIEDARNALPLYSLVRADGYVIATGRWPVRYRHYLLAHWNDIYAGCGPTAQVALRPATLLSPPTEVRKP